MNERMPNGFAAPGKRIWKSVVGVYGLRPDELQILEDACRTADLVARLQKSVDAQGLMVLGSMGQEVINPALQEIRQQRNTLRQLFQRLDLPDQQGERPSASKAKTKAKKAAAVRWQTA